MRILVVEDDAAIRRSVVRVIRTLNNEIVEACSCAEARAATDCGLGVFDVDLPDGDGVELAQELLGAGRVKIAVFHTGRPTVRAAAVGVVVTKGTAGNALRTAVHAASLRLVGPRQ